MIRLTAHLETYLINKGFVEKTSGMTGMSYWRKDISADEGFMEVVIMDAVSGEESEPEVYKTMIRKLAGGNVKFEANFVLSNMLSLQHMESFINANLPFNFPKD